jgi:NAD+ synthase (glutamine-hydrolysing)
MHLAGEKIRAWRESRDPPLSAGEFGELYGVPEPWPSRTVYGWEAQGKIPRASAQRRLAELGICQPEDWLRPAAHQGERSVSGQEHPFYAMHGHGFVRAATSTPRVRTADVSCNRDGIIEEARRAHECHVDLLVYPELCVSSYAIDDLHMQSALLDACETAIAEIVAASAGLTPVLLIGAPLRHEGRLYNCALAVADGKLLGVVPKTYLPNYREYYEKRWFASGRQCRGKTIRVGDLEAPFGTDLIFASNRFPASSCSSRSARTSGPRSRLRRRRAGRGDDPRQPLRLQHRHRQVGRAQAAVPLAKLRTAAAYVYSASGHGESTTDLAWDGQGMIYELGDLLAESERFSLHPELCVADIDTDRILGDRMRLATFNDAAEASGRPEDRFRVVRFDHAPASGRHRPRSARSAASRSCPTGPTGSTRTATRRSTSRSTG